MIKKILIANRGEIALRIIRTCKEMGIKTVALCPFKGQESNFLETQLADEYYFLEREGAKGYLDKKLLIEIAKKAKADALHPGYGFLSENWEFAKLCQKNKIIFIGPQFWILKNLEDKIKAKKIAKKAGIPVLPDSRGPIRTKRDLVKWARKIGSPFVLKALKGGGGVGIRVINGEISLGQLFAISLGIQRQTNLAFSDTDFYLEKCLLKARHIEFQILGDGKNFLHLGERECTIQRRFQKLLEEAPSPYIDEKLREKMGNLAVKLAKSLKYKGVGTVEFLMDENKNFYFTEVNPRIQVEHPVTEAITGIDLVREQIRIAQGEKIGFSQKDISFSNWAMEIRVNAEDPLENFKPSPGRIEKCFLPGGQGIFVHTFLHDGQEIFPYFDPLLAKIIGVGKNRKEAICKLKRALDEIVIEGIKTNIPFFKKLLEDERFLRGHFYTDFLEKSKILEKIKISEVCKKYPSLKRQIDKKEIAKIIYEIYCQFKKTEREKEKPFVSEWQMAERMKMLKDYEI